MTDGFLGYKTSFMLDLVVCALVVLVPLLAYSIYIVKFKRQWRRHRNLQVLLGVVLLLAVGLFEIDLQVVHKGWENIIHKRTVSETQLAAARQVLHIHLFFAVTTPFLWGTTLYLAWRRFPSPPVPGDHSRAHKILGWLSAIDLTLTSVTGLWFYYVAFVLPL